MSTLTMICGFILACLAVSAHSFNHLRMREAFTQCPDFASSKLSNCLNTLTDFSNTDCSSAKEALKCTRDIIQACMDSPEISTLLSNYSLHILTQNFRRVCGMK